MLRRPTLLSALLFALAAGLLHGEENWSQLKLGMTANQAAAALGRPMQRTLGNGFEIWIYDNGAEALLFGSLIGWTTPTSASSPMAKPIERSRDIWSEDCSEAIYPTFLSLLPQPTAIIHATTIRRNAPPPPPPPQPVQRDRDVWLPLYTLSRR